ncbi:sensor histidine kinase [Agromyces mediolanus]|uniref:Histidine kinase/HSP90-like ATPase domain-containing protein n=1 Tax=Agromyces mediolanus TaxID=41986 RepID=A0A918CFA3_AGRME|nr:ATP-binding protein [Agromyces mediolanus]GGR20898.1 hypothetical protein GCM10010196_12850 [Agromyces mediolanus]GLJ73729.1 hypothetical protein GCM10017583_29880 [Agromyces mediolanus]
MTHGLPAPLTRAAEHRALTNAGHAAAFVCLSVGIAIGILAGLYLDSVNGWIGAGLVAAQAAALAVHAVRPNLVTGLVALAAGAAVVFLLVPMLSGAGTFATTNNSISALPRVALVLIGGAGGGTWSAIGWAGAGWLLGELATVVAAAMAGTIWVPNLAAAFALAIVVLVRGFDGLNRRYNGRARPEPTSGGEPPAAVMRREFALRASVRLNELALEHLTKVAAAGSGPIDDRLRQEIDRELSLAIGPDWAASIAERGGARAAKSTGAAGAAGVLAPERTAGQTGGSVLDDAPADGQPAPQPPNRAGSEVERRGGERSATPADEERAELGPFAQVLPTAHEAASNGGLTVRVSGELAQLALLAPARLDALDAAVAQCLVNIVRHAGVSSAEVMIGGGSDELTVAVIDAGVGFDESRVPADRIGLRISIRARVEHEGGTVRLWSKPGVGTTIVLTMPRSAR